MREYSININSKSYKVLVKKLGVDVADLEVNGKIYSVKLDELVQPDAGPAMAQKTDTAAPPPPPPPTTVQTEYKREEPEANGSADSVVVKAPIPGSILGIMCGEGDKVTAGQSVIKMEAMKMENEIKIEVGGTVTAIKVKIGDAVNQGKDLIVVKKDV